MAGLICCLLCTPVRISSFFESHSAIFPFETHRQNLENVLKIEPRTVAPGSAGFRFCGEHAWLNAFLFPISAERFIIDLVRLRPGIDARVMRPGDVFEIRRPIVRHLTHASNIAATEDDDTQRIEFDPTASIPDLSDPNPERDSVAKLAGVTEQFIIEGLGGFALKAEESLDPIIGLYRNHRVRYAIGLVFPDSTTRWYRFDFSERSTDLTVGTKMPGPVDMVHRIAASALARWIERRKVSSMCALTRAGSARCMHYLAKASRSASSRLHSPAF